MSGRGSCSPWPLPSSTSSTGPTTPSGPSLSILSSIKSTRKQEQGQVKVQRHQHAYGQLLSSKMLRGSTSISPNKYAKLYPCAQLEVMTIFLVYIRSTGVNFINVLRKAFTLADPKSIKFQLSRQYLFIPLGSARVKAVQKALMKLKPAR